MGGVGYIGEKGRIERREESKVGWFLRVSITRMNHRRLMSASLLAQHFFGASGLGMLRIKKEWAL